MSSLHSFCIELLIVYGFCIATWALFRTLFVLNRNKIKKNHVDGDCDSNKTDAAATNVFDEGIDKLDWFMWLATKLAVVAFLMRIIVAFFAR